MSFGNDLFMVLSFFDVFKAARKCNLSIRIEYITMF